MLDDYEGCHGTTVAASFVALDGLGPEQGLERGDASAIFAGGTVALGDAAALLLLEPPERSTEFGVGIRA